MNDEFIRYAGLILGWGLVAIGAFGLLRALFRDRSRGRRRCPRCWYSMHGVATMTCPECGRTARKESAFLRTRRRWKRAFVASILPLLGAGLLLTSGVVRLGWQRAIPTTALIFICPVRPVDWGAGNVVEVILDAGVGSFPTAPTTPGAIDDKLRIELRRRLQNGSLWDWQARLLARRIAAAARAAGTDPELFDSGDILDDSWLDGAKPKRGSTLHAELSNFLESLEIDEVSRVVQRMIGATPATLIGPRVLWWEPNTVEEARLAFRALSAAAPDAPASLNPADWEARLALYGQLQETQVDTRAETTLEGIVALIGAASGLQTHLPMLTLSDPRPVLHERPMPPDQCAVNVLDADLFWMSTLHRVPLRWTMHAGGLVIYVLTPSELYAYQITRVYDVRPILRKRLLASAAPDLDAEIDSLRADIQRVVAPNESWSVARYAVNGRLVIRADFRSHLAIEERLRTLSNEP